MMKIITRLIYCDTKNRWEIHHDNQKALPVHCGDHFYILVEGKYLPCRIELDVNWYVDLGQSIFYLHPKMRYRVKF